MNGDEQRAPDTGVPSFSYDEMNQEHLQRCYNTVHPGLATNVLDRTNIMSKTTKNIQTYLE